MNQIRTIYPIIIALQVIFVSCISSTDNKNALQFSLVDADESHITFNNKITESDSINVFTNEYMYNGSGVGVGDFNNDGLQDLFFAGSMVSSQLYLNQGSFKFQEISQSAGIQTNRWCTGVTVIDINNDGFQDIYVSASHSKEASQRANYLFINDGKLHFTDQAAAYGLADTGSATQSVFFDYDQDGDLDVYILNHRLYSHTANNLQPKDTSGNSPAQDKLYRNEGIQTGKNHPVFKDVTIEAGIKEDGYGLGVVVSDFNHDQLPDIYVSNDYIANDLLWLNNGDGTFSNTISTAMKHQSYNSMGVDAADINNDLLPDLASLDMLPETNERKKMMLNASNQEKYDMQQRMGYDPSFMRNMLQLNNGNRTIQHKNQPFFSEIGQLSGIFETDWSWSVLMADFNNDGWKDIHITNGLAKDVTNNDYASFRNMEPQFGTNYSFGVAQQNTVDKATIGSLRKEIDAYGNVKMQNYLLLNNGNLTFSDQSKSVGLSSPSISNGAVYADLDNDGDLDIVVNNMNQASFVWRNELRTSLKDSTNNFLTIQLKGAANNPCGLGTRVITYTAGKQQVLEAYPVRGFSSSVDSRLHFGIGNAKQIDSVKIEWPNNYIQKLTHIKNNQFLVIDQKDASLNTPTKEVQQNSVLFTDISGQLGIDFKHEEVQNYDFAVHQPLFQRYSQLGPCIATGDMNGDGLEDFFVGGATNQSGKIYLQQSNGQFTASELVKGAKFEEDLGAVLFDADGDKDLDLLISGGSFEFTSDRYNQPRLYINDGSARFTLDANALPPISDITHALAVADYDSDGDLDVFIGGRLKSQQYPRSPKSFLLQNNKGQFKDVTKEICPSLLDAGMIDAALFTDFNNDQLPDLIMAGEWTPIRFFKNVQHRFVEVTEKTGLSNMNGWWRSLCATDMDQDGDLDFIAGNMGLNNKYHVTKDRPLFLYTRDLDKNGAEDLIPAYYIKNNKGSYELFPGVDRNQLAEQLPAIKKKYLLHADFATITMNQLLDDFGNENWTQYRCDNFSSVWIENLGKGIFKSHELPMQVQFAPVNTIVAKDFDADGYVDVVLAGNEYQTASQTGRYDASYGTYLRGSKTGEFQYINNTASGFVVDGDVKDLKCLQLKNGQSILLATPNNSPIQTFQINKFPRK